jgi:hypothetical protein
MTRIKAFAAQDAESTLGPWNLERRAPDREIFKLRFYTVVFATLTYIRLEMNGVIRFFQWCRDTKSLEEFLKLDPM